MTKAELLQRLINNHNRIVHIEASGDNLLSIADTIRDLRDLIARVGQEDITDEKENKTEE